jgi:hypothetical protein
MTTIQSFQPTQIEREKASAWIAEQRALPDTEETSAIGGRFTYCFTPTGVGVDFTVIDNTTKEVFDATDYKSW